LGNGSKRGPSQRKKAWEQALEDDEAINLHGRVHVWRAEEAIGHAYIHTSARYGR
jgi:hypothetical protein